MGVVAPGEKKLVSSYPRTSSEGKGLHDQTAVLVTQCSLSWRPTHSQLETLHTERKVVLLCSRLMRGIKKHSLFLFPLIISASLKFEGSPYFNHQFCTIQHPLFGFRFLDSTKKSTAVKMSHEAFHVPAAICLGVFRSALRLILRFTKLNLRGIVTSQIRFPLDNYVWISLHRFLDLLLLLFITTFKISYKFCVQEKIFLSKNF